MIVEIDEIEGDGTEGSAPVTVIPGDSASLPTTPSFPDVQTAMLVGGILGFGFGIAFAMIRTVSDRRIRTADDAEAKTGRRRRRHHPDGARPRRREPARRPVGSERRQGRHLRGHRGVARAAHEPPVHGRRPPAEDHRRHESAPRRRQVHDRVQPGAHPGGRGHHRRARRRRPAPLHGREDDGAPRRCRPERRARRPRRARRGAAAHAQVEQPARARRRQRAAEPERGARLRAHARADRRPHEARNRDHRRTAAAARHRRRSADPPGRRRPRSS